MLKALHIYHKCHRSFGLRFSEIKLCFSDIFKHIINSIKRFRQKKYVDTAYVFVLKFVQF